MKQLKKINATLIFMLGLILLSCQTEDRSIVVATYTYSTNNRIDNLKPFSNNISKILGVKVETKSYPDVASLINGIRSNEVDIAFINTFGYLLLALDNDVVTPIAALNVKNDTKDNYKTVLLANKSTDIKNLESIKKETHNLSMMFVSEGSTSGNLVPRLLLSAIGLKTPESLFKKVQYGGNHTNTFQQLIEGKTDICALGSNEYFKQIRNDSTILNRTKLLWISEEIPLGPVLVKNNLPEIYKQKINKLIHNLHINNPETLASIKHGWSEAKQSEQFVPVTDSYYDNFRNFQGKEADLSSILNLFSK